MKTVDAKLQIATFALESQRKSTIDGYVLITTDKNTMQASVSGHVESLAWAIANACVDDPTIEEVVRKAYRRISLLKKEKNNGK